MIRFILLALFALGAAPSLAASPAKAPGTVRVSLTTSAGVILIDLAMRKAPITAGNFLKYVEQKRLDGTSFYRAARTPGSNAKQGFVQGGINYDYVRMLNPISHEPTSKTGLRHIDGTISMARHAPGTAMGDFFITVGPAPTLDAHPSKDKDAAQGFAAFGQVVGGMSVVKRILASPTYPGRGEKGMKDQMIVKPVRIISAQRVG